MSSRTVSLKGIIHASDGVTTIPPSPTTGVTYRDAAITVYQAAAGWPYNVIVDSAKTNEVLFRVTGLLDQVEKTGFLVWSAYTDYPIRGLSRDPDDGNIYEALAVSGPNSGGTKQPSLYIGTYWKIPDFLAKDGYEIIFTAISLTAKENQQICCEPASGGLTVTLPDGSKNGAKIKVTTGSLVSGTNQVLVSGSVIQETGNTGIIISTPMSTVQFIWNSPSSKWVLGEICYPQTLTTGE